jgi:hypothetical protein
MTPLDDFFSEARTIAINELMDMGGMDGGDARELLKDANLIFGEDVMSKNRFLMYSN